MRGAPSRANSSRLIVSWLRAASSVITLNMSRRSFLAGGGAPASFQHGQAGRYAAFSCQGSSTDFDDISVAAHVFLFASEFGHLAVEVSNSAAPCVLVGAGGGQQLVDHGAVVAIE